MKEQKFYTLPELPYDYTALQPHISEQQLRIHHDKHHAGYVNGSNAILEMMDKARGKGEDFDVKSTLKALSFNLSGHILHSLFWKNLAPVGRGGGKPGGVLGDKLDEEFGGFERFKSEFSKAAASVEGSGWAALTYCGRVARPLIMQIEKHNVNIYPKLKPLMVLDVWEHAYYLDYRNDRGKFIDGFWELVDWSKVEERLKEVL